MKKFLFVLALALGLTSVSHAAVRTPVDSKGATLPTLDLVGANTCRLNVSSSTNGVGCTSAPAIVYAVMASSDALTNFVVFRDSATANTSSAQAFEVYNQGNGGTQATTGTLIQKLPVPVKFSNGVSANMNAAIGTGGEWIVFYRPLSATEN